MCMVVDTNSLVTHTSYGINSELVVMVQEFTNIYWYYLLYCKWF